MGRTFLFFEKENKFDYERIERILKVGDKKDTYDLINVKNDVMLEIINAFKSLNKH